ncbi:hypothetical protein Tco_1329484 [Tanacetum coccineum]
MMILQKSMVEMINEKKKFYAKQKAKAKRSKPMTRAQQREYISTFIKNQSSWKLSQLKKLSFKELKTEFENADEDFGAIPKDFSRDDLIELYGLVIKKYGANRPKEMYDRVLLGPVDLWTMFDPQYLSDDAIWSLPLQQKIINWRYYPTCAVHCLTLDESTIYMLADRKYPLSKDACQVMLKMNRLLDGSMDDVCYQLIEDD